MSELFCYICTKTTNDPYLPPGTADLRVLAREVSDAFVALSGGYQKAGQVTIYPIQVSVPYHLLCDGREIDKASFPELYSFLGETQGIATDPDKFVLPNYIGGALTPAATAATETVNNGTVTTPPPTGPFVPDWYGNYDDADSGGRRRLAGY